MHRVPMGWVAESFHHRFPEGYKDLPLHLSQPAGNNVDPPMQFPAEVKDHPSPRLQNAKRLIRGDGLTGVFPAKSFTAGAIFLNNDPLRKNKIRHPLIPG